MTPEGRGIKYASFSVTCMKPSENGSVDPPVAIVPKLKRAVTDGERERAAGPLSAKVRTRITELRTKLAAALSLDDSTHDDLFARATKVLEEPVEISRKFPGVQVKLAEGSRRFFSSHRG